MVIRLRRSIGVSAKRRGFTLAEAAVSIVLVGVLLTASLSIVGMSKQSQYRLSVHRQGEMLAEALMAEILQQEYEEPTDAVTFGREPGEKKNKRKKYDDVDDYHGWSSTPPESKNNKKLNGLDDWQRTVNVIRVNYADPQQLSVVESGAKRITVTVLRDGQTVAELVAIKSIGLPPVDQPIVVLMLVSDSEEPTNQEENRQNLMESWGFTVNLIDTDRPPGELTAEAADADVVYVPEEVSSADVGTKLREVPTGVVNEEAKLLDEFGIESNYVLTDVTDINITDNTHYITSDYPSGWLTVFSNTQPVYALDGFSAGGLQVLANTQTSAGSKPSLSVIETGGQLYDGGAAADRRVQLPWGASAFNINALNSDGRTILKRALEWAADREQTVPGSCGDGTCDAIENICNCSADCGPPAAFEEPNVTCADGLDNDCDGATDCDDINCGADDSCAGMGAICGNGVCEPGEDCTSCSSDCSSRTTGLSYLQYCCGDGTLDMAEGDGSICDGNP